MYTNNNQEDHAFVLSLMAPNETTSSLGNGKNTLANETTEEDNRNSSPRESGTSSRIQKVNEYSSSPSSNDTSADITCKCVKTKCLQLYCECFHSGIVCNDQCQCTHCGNIEGLERLAKMASVLKRNKNAFDEENTFAKKRRKEMSGCACTSSQ